MYRYDDVCLQSLWRFESPDPSKATLKELKQRHFISFKFIPFSYDYSQFTKKIILYQKIAKTFNNFFGNLIKNLNITVNSKVLENILMIQNPIIAAIEKQN